MKPGKRLATLTVAIVAACALLAPAAEAAFPGRNGRLVAPSSTQNRIVTMKVDGSDIDPISPVLDSFSEAPQVSANGTWVVYDGEDTDSVDLYKVRIDGSGFDQLTDTSNNNEWSPSWTPDGKHIVYARDGGGSQVMMMKADGTGRHEVGNAVGEYPRVSPNGKRIAYGANSNQIRVMKIDGSNDHAVTTGGGDYPDWSPDGKQIIYNRATDIWRVDADGTDEGLLLGGVSVDLGPVYSPNGKRIFYNDGSDLFVAASNGDNPVDVGAAGNCCLGWQPRPRH